MSKKSLHFTVEGRAIAEFMRSFWLEGHPRKAFELGDSMNMDHSFVVSIASGIHTLGGNSDTDVFLEEETDGYKGSTAAELKSILEERWIKTLSDRIGYSTAIQTIEAEADSLEFDFSEEIERFRNYEKGLSEKESELRLEINSLCRYLQVDYMLPIEKAKCGFIFDFDGWKRTLREEQSSIKEFGSKNLNFKPKAQYPKGGENLLDSFLSQIREDDKIENKSEDELTIVDMTTKDEKSCWLSPSGVAYRVNQFDHIKTAELIIKKGIAKIVDKEMNDPMYNLEKQGWAKLTAPRLWSCNQPLTKKQKDVIFDWMTSRNLMRITYNWRDLITSDFLEQS